MHLLLFASTALAAAVIKPLPPQHQPAPRSTSEITTLRLLSTLTHLQHALFSTGCSSFSEADFVSAGFESGMLRNICRILDDEISHASMLAELLGAGKVGMCEYSFEFSNPTSWVDLANEVAMIGVGGWLGGVEAFSGNIALQTLSAQIASVEARHDAFLRAAYAAPPSPTSFDTAIPPSWAYNLAQQWITSCPDGNLTKVNPSLYAIAPWWRDAVEPADPEGTTVSLSWTPSEFEKPIPKGTSLYLAVVNGNSTGPILTKVDVWITNSTINSGTTIIPVTASYGVVFGVLTSCNSSSGSMLNDIPILAGPVEMLLS